MEEKTGMIKQQTQKIVPIGPGEAHLQNKVTNFKCKICKSDKDDMVLLRDKGTEMVMACLKHSGVTQEFIRQFNRPPLGWVYNKAGE